MTKCLLNSTAGECTDQMLAWNKTCPERTNQKSRNFWKNHVFNFWQFHSKVCKEFINRKIRIFFLDNCPNIFWHSLVSCSLLLGVNLHHYINSFALNGNLNPKTIISHIYIIGINYCAGSSNEQIPNEFVDDVGQQYVTKALFH